MHISYSELKLWAECSWKHNLVYKKKIKKFVGNEYTAFGRALHLLCENTIEEKIQEEDYDDFFEIAFEKELMDLMNKDVELNEKMTNDMIQQAKKISPQIIPQVVKSFKNYEVFSVEERLYEDIPEIDGCKFKGFIDLVLKTDDGKYHVIDWKTCSWGWDAKKRSDKYITYQLTLYKKFFCLKHDIDPKLVETHFALLKRTAKKDNVEIFRVTSGPRKLQNATDLLVKGVKSIFKNVRFKNRNSCNYCEFKNTEHCPR
ncbi:PD-(D/E)XK nuclease family protein [bacterium]|nr:PD-(D/E)XK nuclease family protein [bacterium]